MRLPRLLLGFLLVPVAQLAAQDAATIPQLAAAPAVRSALEAIRNSEAAIIDEQIRLCEIPAPPFKETARATAYADALRAAGLKNVRLDKAGNVLGERPGRAARPHLVISAHLDTVFPEGTDVKVSRDGRFLRGPGISDDCRGLAVLVAAARAMERAGIETSGSITFVGTVGEEGLGDLRGVKALFAETLKGRIDRFVSIDGSGHGITHVAVGSQRYRVTYRGPGGHSYDNFGQANPAHALGRAIALISELQVPAQPRTTFSVGRVGGGTSVNALPAEAWMEIDLRSSDPAALSAVDRQVQEIVQRALTLENQRWRQSGRLTVAVERIGERPAGRTDGASPIVQTALAVSKVLGISAGLDEGSTDANVAINLGIPAITTGAGGSSSGTHSLDEVFDTTDSWRGSQRVLLLTIALAN
jgi:acetylornithine deacetylase/succinyl-diaminopimelate desuccinylase-like protein